MILALSGKIKSGKDTVAEIVNELTGNNFEVKKYADKLKDIVCLLLSCNREQLEDREFKEKELGEEWVKYKLVLEVGDADHVSFHTSDSEAREYVKKNFHSFPNPTFKQTYWGDIDIYEIKLTPRKILQLLGTEAGREVIHPQIWVNSLMSEYKPKPKRVSSETKEIWGAYMMSCQECNKSFTTKNKRQNICSSCIDSQGDIYPNWIITDMRFPNELQAVKDKGGITIRINRPETDHLAGDHASETALDNAEFDYVIENVGTLGDLKEEIKQILIKENLI